MSALNDFIDEERALLVSLPVRVGYWMSAVDDDPNTDRDDKREEIAIERTLQMVVSKTDDERFINDIAEFALTNKAEWKDWQGTQGTALDDLPKAFELIKSRLTPKDLKDFKSMVYRMAGVVAQAAGEAGQTRDAGFFGKLLDNVSVKTDMSMPENVSGKEKAALQKLMEVLKG